MLLSRIEAMSTDHNKKIDRYQLNSSNSIQGWSLVNLSLGSAGRSFLVNTLNHIEKAGIGRRSKARILDIGCGVGGLSRAIKKRYPNSKYWAFDIDKAAIRAAKQDSQGIKFFVADAENLSLDEQFDLVIMNSVLDHLEHPHKALKRINKLLKPQGIFISTTPVELDLTTITGYFNKFERFKKLRRKYLGHLHPFDRKSLPELIEKGGLKVKRTTYDWFYLYQIVNLLYYSLVALLKREPNYSVRKYSHDNKGVLARLLELLRRFLVVVDNIESEITRPLPSGFFATITAEKT